MMSDHYLNQVQGAQNLRFQVRQEVEREHEERMDLLVKEVCFMFDERRSSVYLSIH